MQKALCSLLKDRTGGFEAGRGMELPFDETGSIVNTPEFGKDLSKNRRRLSLKAKPLIRLGSQIPFPAQKAGPQHGRSRPHALKRAGRAYDNPPGSCRGSRAETEILRTSVSESRVQVQGRDGLRNQPRPSVRRARAR